MSSSFAAGADGVRDPDVVVGYGSTRALGGPPLLGHGHHLRGGTVIYDGTSIGDHFQTGHNVVVRESVEIGNDVSIWSNTVIDYGCRIGNRVKIHSQCYVAQFSDIEDDAFLAPGVIIANDLYPGDPVSAEAMAGPRIRAGAQVGANVTILPYVTIGRGALIGAGSVVTKDIPDFTIAYGNPAVPVRKVPDSVSIARRVQEAAATRSATPPQAARHTNGA